MMVANMINMKITYFTRSNVVVAQLYFIQGEFGADANGLSASGKLIMGHNEWRAFKTGLENQWIFKAHFEKVVDPDPILPKKGTKPNA